MDVFKSRYYNINRVHLKLLGLWPYENFKKKRVKRIIVVLTVISLVIPQAIRLVEEWNRDIDIVIEVIGSLAYFLGSQVKYLSFLRVETKMKFLYEKILEHWKLLTKREEVQKLEEYGEIGRILTIGYLIPINVILIGYVALPLYPLLLDVIDPLNETRPRTFPYFAEYFIDDQKYYSELTVHGWIVCITSVQIYGSFDTTYTQCVQHACGLFAIVELRMQKACELAVSSEFSSKKERDKASYNSMRDAIRLHKEAIHFVDLIEEGYSTTYFIIVIFNIAAVTVAAVVTMMHVEQGNMKQAMRIGMIYFGFSFHMLYNMTPGQRVIDSSSNVQIAAFHCHWFNVAPKTKQLVKIIMLRSFTPCQFTAGKLIVLDLENFAFVFKKSLSYVTVLGSMR